MRCPKCDFEQSKGKVCIECGVIFAKYYAYLKRKEEAKNKKRNREEDQDTEEVPLTGVRYYLAWVRHIATSPWKPVSTPVMGVLSFMFAVLFLALFEKGVWNPESGLLRFVHDVNLVFHEAGHWIFGVFGNRTLTILGGSLNQVLIPLIIAGAFWQRRDAAGFTFAIFWCGESMADVAVYMYDAPLTILPLLGGMGEESHDWRNLFLSWGMLDQAFTVAKVTKVLGYAGMVVIWVWLLMRWNKGRKNSSGI